MIFYVEIGSKEQEDAKVAEFKEKIVKQGISESDILILTMIGGVRTARVEFAPPY